MNTFPLSGIAGIVAEDARQIDLALAQGLGTVEIRGDLLLDAEFEPEDVMDIVGSARAHGLSCLFTLRHPTHGGKFAGSEGERVQLNLRALEAGAHVVDAELGTEAAQALLDQGAPVLLSHHDFEKMPGERELAALTDAMRRLRPLGMKLVPTARTLGDAARMLAWVADCGRSESRIGFAMGAAGTCSRILAIAFGSPITYASFGASVAPGQVELGLLANSYRADHLDSQTRVFGVAGADALASPLPIERNHAFASNGINAVYVPFPCSDARGLLDQLDTLRIDGLDLQSPLDEDILALADEVEPRCAESGRADTLVVARGGAGRHLKACEEAVSDIHSSRLRTAS